MSATSKPTEIKIESPKNRRRTLRPEEREAIKQLFQSSDRAHLAAIHIATYEDSLLLSKSAEGFKRSAERMYQAYQQQKNFNGALVLLLLVLNAFLLYLLSLS